MEFSDNGRDFKFTTLRYFLEDKYYKPICFYIIPPQSL